MANTIVSRTLVGSGNSKRLVLLINLTSDGTQETNTIIYQNSSFANDVTKGNLQAVRALGASCQVTLTWDQTTKSDALTINPAACEKHCFREFGGIHNPHGTGANGNLLLTTLGLASGNKFTLVLEIDQN